MQDQTQAETQDNFMDSFNIILLPHFQLHRYK
jgi:hypothetical protein